MVLGKGEGGSTNSHYEMNISDKYLIHQTPLGKVLFLYFIPYK